MTLGQDMRWAYSTMLPSPHDTTVESNTWNSAYICAITTITVTTIMNKKAVL